MRSLILLLSAFCVAAASYSHVTIKLEDVGAHIGDSVKVCGRVAGIRFMESAKGQPTLINIGAAYPNQLLTVVIWADARKQFDKVPEEFFKDKDICITGHIELFRDKPQIIVRAKEQVQLQVQ